MENIQQSTFDIQRSSGRAQSGESQSRRQERRVYAAAFGFVTPLPPEVGVPVWLPGCASSGRTFDVFLYS
jgi:hypothetical protein